MKCSICAKNIIGSEDNVCYTCKRGVSPEAVKIQEQKIKESELNDPIIGTGDTGVVG